MSYFSETRWWASLPFWKISFSWNNLEIKYRKCHCRIFFSAVTFHSVEIRFSERFPRHCGVIFFRAEQHFACFVGRAKMKRKSHIHEVEESFSCKKSISCSSHGTKRSRSTQSAKKKKKKRKLAQSHSANSPKTEIWNRDTSLPADHFRQFTQRIMCASVWIAGGCRLFIHPDFVFQVWGLAGWRL